MTREALQSLFARDLKKLRTEIELYKNEASLWHVEKDIANSAGNLCLHLVGNLHAYIGVGLGKIDFVRQRDLEFSLKDVPKIELLEKIDATISVVELGLNKVDDDKMDEDFPIVIWDKPTKTGYTLIHLLAHLNYHLGQINYHRRLLDK
jgi:uncharacterized damage-inducible protein DinB